MRLIVSLIVLSIGLGGCASSLPDQTPASPSTDIGLAVNLADTADRLVTIDESAGVGPQLIDESSSLAPSEKAAVNAVNFVDAGNLSVAYIGYLKATSSINYSLVSGTGMGALVAALYCAGKAPDHIEWFFYKLSGTYQEKRLQYLSNAWFKVMTELIEKEFGQQRLESFPKTCIIPIYHTGRRQVEYHRRGAVVPLLIANLEFLNQKSAWRSPVIHPSLIDREFKKLGADHLTMVRVPLDNLQFKKWDSYILGTYGRADAMSKMQSSSYDQQIELPIKNILFDDFSQLPSVIQQGMRQTNMWLETHEQTQEASELEGVDDEE